MITAYKKKIATTAAATWTALESAYAQGAVRIKRIYYSNATATEYLEIRDADGDVILRITSAGAAQYVDFDIPVNLPLDYYDSDAGGGNEIRIFGEFLP